MFQFQVDIAFLLNFSYYFVKWFEEKTWRLNSEKSLAQDELDARWKPSQVLIGSFKWRWIFFLLLFSLEQVWNLLTYWIELNLVSILYQRAIWELLFHRNQLDPIWVDNHSTSENEPKSSTYEKRKMENSVFSLFVEKKI